MISSRETRYTGSFRRPEEATVTTKCPFCAMPRERVLFENEHAIVIRDGYPISPGHTLVVPKRHVASLFETTPAEERALLAALRGAREALLRESPPPGRDRPPAAFNIGVNDGTAAGQTVAHLHIHLIPRWEGDVPDPRGGVRWIFPDKADYWTRARGAEG